MRPDTTSRAARRGRGPARPLALALLATLVLAACASPDGPPPMAPPEAPTAWQAAATPASAPAPAPVAVAAEDRWWRAFGDDTLSLLVEQALKGSTTVQAAAARLAEARALLGDREAARRPTVDLAAGVSRGTLPPGTPGARPGQAADLGTLGVQAAWEPDLFGRLSREVSAATLDVQARQALLAGARLAVAAHVAQAYFALRALDQERALVRETVETWDDTLRLTERRAAAGEVGEFEVTRLRADVSGIRAQSQALDRERASMQRALAVLLGELPESFSLAPAADLPLVRAWPDVAPGLPAQVLARRPDVAAAQARARAAQARVGVAKAAWFPDVALTATGGAATTDLGQVLKWSARAWGLGLVAALPVFDGGRREAGVQAARARWDEAAADYRQQVLQAFEDVEDHLDGLQRLREQADTESEAVAAARRAASLSEVRWQRGHVSQLELLDARRVELQARRDALRIDAERARVTVGLVQALGGGWR